MRNIKAFLKSVYNILRLPAPLTRLVSYMLTIAFASLSVLSLVTKPTPPYSYLVYIIYSLAALALSYSVYITVRFAPQAKISVLNFLSNHSLTKRLVSHYDFRTLILLALSFCLNFAYAVFCAVIAILTRTVWYGSLAAYYIFLTVMRGGIVFYHGKARKSRALSDEERHLLDVRKYRSTGIMLMLMPLCLSFAIWEMVSNGGAYEYGSLMIYAVAAYTFWKITMSVINLVKAGKSNVVTLMAVRNIGFADSLVSLLALQSALLQAFGDGIGSGFANAATGTAVCLLTFLTGLYMIINLRKIKNGKQENI